ncbi:SDR family oxidoreductase [Streptomyces sp. SID13666]|uniref:SDR family NAD(P)-dependent oxidoreductase n=1 Tax=unclassified Streptomyces TaxID=2593676 RepID=UPI0013C1FDD7|nr:MULTISPECIES: SDR family oxidoreductase [unclassified Streptomyces]NEA57511.1 SDR family oxidoreductase [Streptomyces sp. SID13666]NEA70985.1 SDR family oxidoreductase [Streptomyces sp. SID13588]
MQFDLTGKTAVVTGAGSGIGLASVQALAAAGAQVLGGSRTISPELLDATPHVFEVDLLTEAGPTALLEHALGKFGGVDILVNNVGGGVKLATGFLDIEDETWRHTFELNVFSMIRTTRAALPSLVERRGAIINIGSMNASMADPALGHYSAAKAALANISKSLSLEFSSQGVTVNTISPGPVRTRLWTNPEIARRLGITTEEFLETVPKMAGLSTGKMIEPDEIGALVLLLASGKVPSITGSDYFIDGGMSRAAVR